MSLLSIDLDQLKRISRRSLNWAVKRPAAAALARERRRLAKLPRYVATRTPLLSLLADDLSKPWPDQIEVPDAASFLAMADEIFVRRMYAFSCTASSPRIVDVGANIGVSVLYFQAAYPAARIVALEADPALFEYLSRNIHSTQAGSIQLFNVAAWNQDTILSFNSEGADAGRVATSGEQSNNKRIEVPARRLRDFLDCPTALLKIDIEGAEICVLQDCADLLHWVDHLFVEYHSMADQPQQLHTLLAILSSAGFRVVVEATQRSRQPLIAREIHFGMDLQVNIFAYRTAGPAPQ